MTDLATYSPRFIGPQDARLAVMLAALLAAAIALSVERACYVWIARAPRRFRAWCARPTLARLGEPVAIVRLLFCGFKVVQISVFCGWCAVFGHRALTGSPSHAPALLVGTALLLVGQTLNWSVFYRLGAVGVFYGDRLGHDVPRCEEFPFSLIRHPQYVGTVLSIWGFFIATRFPHDDWILLPTLETAYYVVGTYLEERTPTPAETPPSVLDAASASPLISPTRHASAAEVPSASGMEWPSPVAEGT